jgi:serine/threonine-protein kinase PpkA
MICVLVIDDEEAIRKNVERMLTLEGYQVATAADGQQGLALALANPPDVLITDINMPVMDGFELLEALRTQTSFATVPIIMLTAAEDRTKMRKGMRMGADDYLTKPFKREELLDSINAQLQKFNRFAQAKEQAVAQAVAASEEKTREMFQDRYSDARTGNAALLTTKPNFTRDPQVAGSTLQATVMFADIRNFTSMAERLSAHELATLLGKYFEEACRPVLAYGGVYLKMMGDGLLALFEDSSQQHVLPHARRAVTAALGLRQVAHDFRQWLVTHFGERGLPEFSVGIGLHSGTVTLGRLGGVDSMEITPLGDCVNVASRLQDTSKQFGWTVVASMETVHLVQTPLQKGHEQLVHIRGREAPVHACEINDLDGVLDFQLPAENTSEAANRAIKNAARENSEFTARAAKDALNHSLVSLQAGDFSADHPLRFKGYHVLSKLGKGGMSDVYLAHSIKATEAQRRVVLKVLRTGDAYDADMLRRFIQEYAILARINHLHVAKIYEQGFTDEYAYIAMEYLAGGDLKFEIALRPDHARVLYLLGQIVSALDTIHSLGLVYRDLKPENLMFRSANELVLVDFGIAKSVRYDEEFLVNTQHGLLIGTPYYISPEQATGINVTHRADFYSLGIMLHELLTGEKPYHAYSLDTLLARHMYGSIPVLPPEHAAFQDLLTRLMAKLPEDRPTHCAEIQLSLQQLTAQLVVQ